MTWPPLPNPYYSDDAVALYHGDGIEGMSRLAAGSVAMVLTDPPYGHNNNNGDLAHRWEAALGLPPRGTSAEEARPIANDGAEATPLVAAMFAEAARVMEEGGCCCCCCGGGGGPDPQFARWSMLLDGPLNFKQMVVWDKLGLGMGWHYRRSYEVVLVGEKPGAACKWYGGASIANIIRDIPGIKPPADGHPTPKPVRLFTRFIEWHSLPGEVVLDPFIGGGTTAEAAKRLGRKCIGFDVEERWLEMAAKRCRQEVLL
jgi:site-specific DNA-methyltransferase (adenine-specific)